MTKRRTQPNPKTLTGDTGPGAIDSSMLRSQRGATLSDHHAPADGHADPLLYTAESVLRTRELYWHNVVREMLNSLCVMCQTQPELFDGRFAVLTHAGERIAIGQIFPLFACSLPQTPWEREASLAVQCTIFRVRTPDGEVYTLPVHEVRGMHSLTPELIEQLQKATEDEQDESAENTEGTGQRPFGLAAFTSLPKPATPPFGPRGPDGGD